MGIEPGTYSRIEKKGLGENPVISISPTIPEPSSLALIGVIGCGAFGIRRFFQI